MLGVVAAIATCVPAARAYTSPPPPNIDWTRLLPPLSSPASVQPHDIPGCATPTPACVDQEITGLTALRNRFGCDHRAIFATTYLQLTQTLRDTVTADPHLFDDMSWLEYEDAEFAHLYFATVAAYDAGQPVAPAWKIAFDTARSGSVTAFQDMMLGINAHVQNDMPYMLAAVGLRKPADGAAAARSGEPGRRAGGQAAGTTHKPDHQRVNEVLRRAFAPVIAKVGAYDSLVCIMAPSWTPIDDLTGLQLVQVWREIVWREAEQLLNAQTQAQRQVVEDGIAENAALTARPIAAPPFPGYRMVRDAYCRAHVL